MNAVVLLDVHNESSAATAPADRRVRECVEQAIVAVRGEADATFEVSVKFVDEHEGRLLNRKYRAQDCATNVLSFPAERPRGLPASEPELLGDIVICGSIVEREAREQGKEAAGHWDHMLIHGTLHLLGFDHQDDREAAEMEDLETELLAARGIENPYPGPTV
jgi:probable rRNA maturation factor